MVEWHSVPRSPGGAEEFAARLVRCRSLPYPSWPEQKILDSSLVQAVRLAAFSERHTSGRPHGGDMSTVA
jgi:hypothetical protein